MNLFDVYPRFDIEIVKGKGCTVWDEKDTEYIDLYGGHAVISVGHSHPVFVSAINEQAQKLVFYSNSVINNLQEKFAQRLGEVCGYPDYNLFLVNSGAEANENALKLASFHTGRKRIISFNKSFHGRTSAAVDVTDNNALKAPINISGNVEFLPFNDINRASQEIDKGDVAAVIVEPVQGIGGIREATGEFLTALRTLTKKNNTILIFDEVQCGYGRTGKFFAHQWHDVTPDLITVGKGIANGLPMAGVLISPIFEAKYGLLGTTFGGNHLVCAAALSVLKIIEEEKLIENALNVGNFLISELQKIDSIKEVRGKGLIIGIEFEKEIKELRNTLIYKEHVFTGISGKNIIRILPPLVLDFDTAEIFIKKLKRSLS